jgi:hypothetical protein
MTTYKCFYSDNKESWVPARDYQSFCLHKALDWYNDNKTVYKYDNGSINLSLIPHSVDNKNEKVFIMVRSDNTTAYLKMTIPRYAKMVAPENSNIMAEYSGLNIKINPGTTYYIDCHNDNKIVVGWHGSINPPCGMDGEVIIPNEYL